MNILNIFKKKKKKIVLGENEYIVFESKTQLENFIKKHPEVADRCFVRMKKGA